MLESQAEDMLVKFALTVLTASTVLEKKVLNTFRQAVPGWRGLMNE